MSTTTKVGHGLAKVLGIKLDQNHDPMTRGESVFSVSSADTYVEGEPTVWEWILEHAPTRRDILLYLRNLFPFTHWITRYNLQWLAGDLIAGVTVGCVVVPQSMAYAGLANLAPEFGLYSSFMGVLIYWFFATSKDITIGPVAVMSAVTGEVVTHAKKTLPKVPGWQVASALAIICGAVVAFIGFARLGFLVELISLTAISAFMTGSAINIAVGQVPTMMGITGFSTRDATYKVVINTLKHLGRSDLNAAMGLTALFLLYTIRSACNQLAKRYPNKRKLFFFLSTLRTAFVILLYTLISWLVNRHHRKKPLFKILGKVPRGFQHAQVPVIDGAMISGFASKIPASVIVLLIEHISISKSFGRINNYTIDPSQELVAIGVTNLLGPFVGAYPATGSFSRTAIKSKAGVRTPFAGVITAVIVLLAIYALTAVFFYIPSATLAGVIIHAVGDLITPPSTIYHFWRISPLEVIIFFAGVFVTVFSTIENGIYTTVACSAAVLFFRLFKAKGHFLGRVKAHSVIGDQVGVEPKRLGGPDDSDPDKGSRNIFLPIDHHDGSNPLIDLAVSPAPGIFMFRFSEGFNYPNANHYLDYMVETIFKQTRRTNTATYPRPGDRPWNDPGPRRGQPIVSDEHKPTLKAIILDFASVNNVDITSTQHLIDVRNQLDRYAAPDTVDWHFANINNRWTKRALAAAGFGFPTEASEVGGLHRHKPIFSVAEIGGSTSAATEAEERQNKYYRKASRAAAAEEGRAGDHIGAHSDSSSSIDKQLTQSKTYGPSRTAIVHGINRPLFHVDLTSALQSAIANSQRRPHSAPIDVEVEADDKLPASANPELRGGYQS